MAADNNANKIPMRQAEVSLSRFNDMAIPHNLGLLKNHRSNIEKSLALGDWNKIRKEEINAMGVIKKIKNLLIEMDELREKVREEDLQRFDALLEIGKQKAFESMKEYLELELKSPRGTSHSSQSPLFHDDDDYNNQSISGGPLVEIGTTPGYQNTIPCMETNFDLEEHQLAQRETCLEELENLQHQIRDINIMFHKVQNIVHEQGEMVQAIADNAEEALENVQAGESNLRRALSYKKAMYPLVGALLGTCVGGPIGLVAGLKAGGLAAIGCGFLGFTGGSVLKGNQTTMHGNIFEEQQIEQTTEQSENGECIELNKKDE